MTSLGLAYDRQLTYLPFMLSLMAHGGCWKQAADKLQEALAVSQLFEMGVVCLRYVVRATQHETSTIATAHAHPNCCCVVTLVALRHAL